jgi:hypothetical protein
LAGCGAALALLAVGGFFLPAPFAGWTILAAFSAFAIQVGLLLLLGFWSRHLALLLLGASLVGLGGILLHDSGDDLAEQFANLAAMRLKSPWWLLLLLTIPVLVALSWRRLSRESCGPGWRWGSVSLACPFLPWRWPSPSSLAPRAP